MTESARLKRIPPVVKGPEGWERVITPNGDGGARVSLPRPVLEALGIATGVLVTIDIKEGEIRIRKKEALPNVERRTDPW